jgi:hypothetical protein
MTITQRLTIKPAQTDSIRSNLMNVSFEFNFSNEQLHDFMIIEEGVKAELAKTYSDHLGHAFKALTLLNSPVDTVIVERESSIKLKYLPETVTVGIQESEFTTFVISETSDLYVCSAYSGPHKVKSSYPKNQDEFLKTNSLTPVQVLLEVAKHELQTLKQ